MARAGTAAMLALAGMLSFQSFAFAESEKEPAWHHASSLSGTPKYGPDVTHFDYVNPQAPKGGLVRLSTSAGFDTFNPILPKGTPVNGLSLVYESLMTSGLDEPDISADYGLIAEALRYPDDYSWVEYRLNPKAKWHDGTAITADDVVWSFEKAVELNPKYKFYYHDVSGAKKVSDSIVRFEFAVTNNRELPHIVGQLMVLPKDWWEGVDEKGEQRDIGKSTLEMPLGSGPYKIKSFSANRDVTYERVKDYWGANLPVRVGTNNFDEIRFISFMDDAVELESFKGDQYDFRDERSASRWSTSYDFPAVSDGRVILEEFPDYSSGRMQAFVPNLRVEKFQDPDVRLALNYAYDFETTNEVVSAGLYDRINSYFAGTELASSGLPEGLELEILEEVRDLVPPEVFTTEFKNPVGGDQKKIRANLREAVKLLRKAGYKLDKGKMLKADSGEQLSIEFLYYDKSAERTLLPYVKNLNSIGIQTELRLVDYPQYANRIRSRDFEMVTLVWPQSLSPGNEQREFWGSDSADKPGSWNHLGLKDPGVDKLVDRIVFAKDRAELVAATKALDRVLLWHHLVIPQFYSTLDRTARWNRFSHPENLPEFSHNFPALWWYDEAKAEKTGVAK
ncbi:MAG: ABC transporter substrate-binding protein [Rhodobacteraceae bacterium]|nr:ABC transporter substrate-binding protein [Paracoccaceae bacterium]